MKFPKLYHLDSKNNIREWSIWTEGADIVTSHGIKDGTAQIARKTAKPKNIGKSNATTAEEQAISEAQSMHKKKLEQKYTEDPSGIKVLLRPMLAHKTDLEDIQYPIFIQPKLDGIRCLIYWDNDDIVLESREGKKFDIPHIKESVSKSLPKDMILDGELYKHGVLFETLVSWVKKPKIKERTQLEFHYYDCIIRTDTNLNQQDRLMRLDDISGDNLISVQWFEAEDREFLDRYTEMYLQKGYEGIILRNPKGIYKVAKRSRDLLKYKNFVDDEFEIIGYKDGEGKERGAVIWICKTKDGKEFDVRPTGTYESRQELFKNGDTYIGKLLTVKYQNLTDDGKPRFCVGKTIRDYE